MVFSTFIGDGIEVQKKDKEKVPKVIRFLNDRAGLE